MAYLYILHSDTLDRYYIGSTRGSVEERLRRHLSAHQGFTGKAKDWEIIYCEFYADYQAASLREKSLKRQKDRHQLEMLAGKSSDKK